MRQMKDKMLLLAVMVGFLLALAGCDFDEPWGPDHQRDRDVTATATYTVEFGDDFFKAAKVIIYYKTADNNYDWDALTSGSKWTRTIKTSEFPAQLGYLIEVSPLEGEALTQETYDMTLTGSISATTSRGDSFSNVKTFINNNEGLAVPADRVDKLIKSHSSNVFGYILTRDGSTTQTSFSF